MPMAPYTEGATLIMGSQWMWRSSWEDVWDTGGFLRPLRSHYTGISMLPTSQLSFHWEELTLPF